MSQTVRPWGVAAAAVLAGGALSAAHAESGDAETRLLDRIMITGGPDRVQDTAGSAQVLSREDIDRQGYTDPHRILRQIPGVNVAEEEGYGQFPHISMRGVNPERNARITVMEDGVLTASPAPYAAPAAYYFPPMGRMDNVEVRKGSSAIKHGPYTVGGALNMTSTPIPQERSGKVEGRLGSDNGRRAHAHIGGREGQFGWLLESYTEQSDGFKELDHPLSGDQSNKPNNPVPNTGFDRNNFVAKGMWASDPTAEVYQEVEFKYARDRRTIHDTYLGLLPDDFDDNPHRRYAGSQLDEINTENDLYQVRHYFQPTVDTDVTTTLYRTDTVRNWYKLHEVRGDGNSDFEGISDILRDPGDHEDELAWILGGFGTAYDAGLSIEDGARGNVRANNREYYAQGIQVQVGHLFQAFGWDHDMEVGFRYHEDEEDREQWQDSFEMQNGMMVLYEHEEPGETTNRVTSAEAYAFHVQNTMERGSWTLVPGVRYENIDVDRKQWDGPGRTSANLDADGSYSNTYRVWVPGMGATYAIDDQWSVLGGVHRGFAPSGADPQADEERSVNYEAGFRFSDMYTQAEVIGFFNDYSNINYECTNVGGACQTDDELVSAGEVHVWGLEALWMHDLGQSQDLPVQLPVSVSYTFTDSEFRQDIDDGPNQLANARKGDRLPEIPEHQLNLSAGVGQADWRVNLNANYVSETRALADRDYDDLKIDSRWLFDLSAHYQLMDNVRLLGSIENLTDETYVAHHRPAGARPGAPRTYWAGMRVDF